MILTFMVLVVVVVLMHVCGGDVAGYALVL